MVIDASAATVRMSWGEYRRELEAGRIRRRLSETGWWWIRRPRNGRRLASEKYRALVRPDFRDPLDPSEPIGPAIEAQLEASPRGGLFDVV